MAKAGDDLPPRPVTLHDLAGGSAQVLVGRRFLQRSCCLLDRPSEPIAHAKQSRGDRGLQGLGRPVVGEARGDRARREAVLDEGDGEGVEHYRLMAVGQAALELEEGHVAERDLADEVGGQVVAADEDLVGGAVAEGGVSVLAFFPPLSLALSPAGRGRLPCSLALSPAGRGNFVGHFRTVSLVL